jgi:hypothetical protein
MRYIHYALDDPDPKIVGEIMANEYYRMAREKMTARGGMLETEDALQQVIDVIRAYPETDPIAKKYLNELEQKGGHFATLAARWKKEFPNVTIRW